MGGVGEGDFRKEKLDKSRRQAVNIFAAADLPHPNVND